MILVATSVSVILAVFPVLVWIRTAVLADIAVGAIVAR